MKRLRRILGGALAFALTVGSAVAAQVDVVAGLGTPVVKAGKAQPAFLKVSLKGFELADKANRAPTNIVIVLDKSGSMAGDKLRSAKAAAADVVGRLSHKDIVSVVTYDDTVDVIVPATRAVDKAAIIARIDRVRSGGSTALYAGVSKGAHEVRKFLDRRHVNRIILLSDGLANVGPSSPHELGRLGYALGREGIAVTTIGLGAGYNEDLMVQLANNSDGNHAFVEHPRDLGRIFGFELGDVTSVVAQEVEVAIRLAPGVRPVQVLGREAEIAGQTVRTRLNQLYGAQEKYVLLEVEIPPGREHDRLKVADVDVSYLNMESNARDALARAVAVSYTDSAEKVASATNKNVMSAAVEQVANTMRAEAIGLRDRGKNDEAQRTLDASVEYLNRNAREYDDDSLRKLEREARQDAKRVKDGADWGVTRKELTDKNFRSQRQQSYR